MFFQAANTASTRKPLFLLALLLLAVLVLSPIKAGAQSAEISSIVTIDADGDELSDEQELELGTDPYLYDTDGDALGDGAEVREDGWGTNPLKGDTDDDGFWDGDELFTYGTDPKDPESRPAEQVQSTIRISVRGLPIAYDGNDFANDSTALEDIEVSVVTYGGDIGWTARTDEAGIATFNNLQEGNYQVILGIPGESANFVTVFGTEDGFEPREHEGQDTNQPVVYLGPTEQLNGTFYVLPFEDGGPQDLSSFQINVRSLPAGFTEGDAYAESTPLAGINVTVAIPGSEFAVTAETDASGQAGFGGLSAGEYQVILGIPGHDAKFKTVFRGVDDTDPRPHDGRDTNTPTVHLNGGELLTGTFFVLPYESGAPEQELGSFQIDVRSLPADYDGNQWWNDSDPLAGIEVTVAIPGSEFGVTAKTNASGQAFFEDLGEGDYYVILGIPGHDAEFVTYFAAATDTEARPHDGKNTNQTTVHLNAGETLYGTFYVLPVDAGAEPTKTPAQVGGEPVKDLPNTGAGSENGSGFGTEVFIALTAVVVLATLGRVATRRRA